MKVPFLDLKSSYLELKDDIDKSISRVLTSGSYVLGKELELFESEWAEYCQSKNCVGVGNGLDALILSLKVSNIGEGDEVIVPGYTFIATWLAISAVGAIPVPIEPNKDSFNIDFQLISEKISKKTKAIIAVHLYGLPANLDQLNQIAKDNNLILIEDAAQAHGAFYKNKRIGSHSDLVCWSFYPGKNLGCFGDGGAITTDSKELSEKLKVLRNYGSNKKYIHKIKGINSRLDPIQAAILRVKLKHLDIWNNRRRVIAEQYNLLINNQKIITPYFPIDMKSSHHLFVIKCASRDKLIEHLNNHYIESLIHYPIPPHLQNAYVNQYKGRVKLPITIDLSNQILSLPIGPHMNLDMVNHVINIINEF